MKIFQEIIAFRDTVKKLETYKNTNNAILNLNTFILLAIRYARIEWLSAYT